MSAKYFKIQEADKNVRNFRNVRICLEISDIFLKVKDNNVRKLQSENTKMSENSLEVKGLV